MTPRIPISELRFDPGEDDDLNLDVPPRPKPFNAVAAILNADRVWPEPLSLPDALEGADPITLAEARSRLTQIAQIARELTKLIDVELAGALQGSAMLYGQDVYRPSNGKGTAKVADEGRWWETVVAGLQASPRPEELLAALYPASSVRLTALPKLSAAISHDADFLKREFIVYEPSTAPLSVMPISKAPKFLADLEEGEVRSLQ